MLFIRNPHRCQEMDCRKISGEVQLFLITSIKIKIDISQTSLLPPWWHLFHFLYHFFFIIPFFFVCFILPFHWLPEFSAQLIDLIKSTKTWTVNMEPGTPLLWFHYSLIVCVGHDQSQWGYSLCDCILNRDVIVWFYRIFYPCLSHGSFFF